MDTGSIVNLLLALAATVVLVVACGLVARKFVLGGSRPGGRIQVLASTPVGNRERLLVVDVMGEQKLIGVTAQQITDLGGLKTPLEPVAAPAATDRFAATLSGLLKSR